MHVILAIDVSSSIRARLHFEQRAASTFLKHILRKDSDKAAIIAFGSTVQEKTAGMSSVTHETGGFVLPAREDADLRSAFNMIEKILRSQYALGYPPPDLDANGSFRSIEVSSSKSGLQIHTRKGYYAPAR